MGGNGSLVLKGERGEEGEEIEEGREREGIDGGR